MEDLDMQIVQGLKDPWKFLFVDMDVAMLSGGVGFMALTSGAPTVLALAVGCAVGYGMHATRKGKPRGYAKYLSYWYLPPLVTRLQRVPPAWAQRTVG